MQSRDCAHVPLVGVALQQIDCLLGVSLFVRRTTLPFLSYIQRGLAVLVLDCFVCLVLQQLSDSAGRPIVRCIVQRHTALRILQVNGSFLLEQKGDNLGVVLLSCEVQRRCSLVPFLFRVGCHVNLRVAFQKLRDTVDVSTIASVMQRVTSIFLVEGVHVRFIRQEHLQVYELTRQSCAMQGGDPFIILSVHVRPSSDQNLQASRITARTAGKRRCPLTVLFIDLRSVVDQPRHPPFHSGMRGMVQIRAALSIYFHNSLSIDRQSPHFGNVMQLFHDFLSIIQCFALRFLPSRTWPFIQAITLPSFPLRRSGRL
mmetsp:Transcript_21815/g.44214  ORF Transcript_21815/g.44214 Transcript_21815/m.44214 type:complete len:314 (-) Transcript_21815:227-1168(-)